jgi:hypothetical protein
MSSDGTTKTSCLVGGLVLGLALGIYAGAKLKEEHLERLDQWDKAEAEQYKIATKDGGKWGEIIHEYEGFSCEAHRWRYRGVFYIGHVGFDCGDLILEATHK